MLFLASTSPRRRELMQQVGWPFEVVKISVDETPLEDESPSDYVARLAVAKAQAGLALVESGDTVLGADTTVVLDGEVLGKPADREEAFAMWSRMAGRVHQVLTGVALARDGAVIHRVVVTEVHFRQMTRLDMEAYWASGEPADKAGGYGIQGRGALLVDRISGSYSNVVGLPLAETAQLLTQFGYSVWMSPE